MGKRRAVSLAQKQEGRSLFSLARLGQIELESKNRVNIYRFASNCAMREALKAAKIAGIAGLLVYLTWSIIAYLNLVANQPIEGKPLPEHFTSFPPYVAWIFSIPIGLFTFIGVFLVALIVLKIQKRSA